MRAGWEGAEGEENQGEAAKRLKSGSRAREDKLAAVTERQIKESPWTGLRRKESVGGNERTKQAVCVPMPDWSLPFLHDK